MSCQLGELGEQAILEMAILDGACNTSDPAVVPDLSARRGGGIVADGEPGLGEVSLFEVVGGGRAAHPGRDPAEPSG